MCAYQGAPGWQRKSHLATLLGLHRRLRHNGANFKVGVKILAREPQTPTGKTLEALWIKRKVHNESQGRRSLNHAGTCAISRISLLIRRNHVNRSLVWTANARCTHNVTIVTSRMWAFGLVARLLVWIRRDMTEQFVYRVTHSRPWSWRHSRKVSQNKTITTSYIRISQK